MAGPTPVVSELYTKIRERLRDTGTPSGESDAQLLSALNRGLWILRGTQDDRVVMRAHNAVFAAINSGDNYTLASVATDIERFVRLYVASGNSVITPLGAEIEIAPVWKVISLQQEQPTTGAITMAGMRREETPTAANVGMWRAYWWPIPNATTYLISECIVQPAALVNASDRPDVSPAEAMVLVDIAALFAAPSLGRYEMMPAIMQGLQMSAPQIAERIQERNQRRGGADGPA